MLNNFPFTDSKKIYFDSAATSLKPKMVIDAEASYYYKQGVNSGRGTSIHNINSTNVIEGIRERVSNIIGSTDKTEIIFTQNTTDSINMVANDYVRNLLKTDSNIVITQLEHHSNYVPWINLAKEYKVECRIIPLKGYQIDYSYIDKYIDENTVITAVTGMSNVTGDKTDLEPFIKRCREKGSKILIDAAQLIVHNEIDIKKSDIDFLVFSAHKLYSTFGLGFLYGKSSLLESFKPTRFGGNMVSYVTNLVDVNFKSIPSKLEIGTQNSAAIYAFDKAMDFMEQNCLDTREKIIIELSKYLLEKLSDIEDIIIYSTLGSIISFNIVGVHPHDASSFFDDRDIIVRCGNLCASPFFTNLKESGVIRVSLGIHNSRDEINKLIETIYEIKEFFL